MSKKPHDPIPISVFLTQEIKDNSIYVLNSNSDKIEVKNGYGNSLDYTIDNGKGKQGANNLPKSFTALQQISKEINDLLRKEETRSENLFTFGQEFEFARDLFFMNIHGNSYEDCRIETGNLIGSVNIQQKKISHKIDIGCRFGIEFLKLMIAYSEGFLELPDSSGKEKSGLIKWALIYLWKFKLRKAFSSCGILKEYRTHQNTLPLIRGNFDISAYLNRPFLTGKFPCQYREHGYDNPVNRLIAMTFAVVEKTEQYSMLIEDCLNIKNVFSQAVSRPFVDLRQRFSIRNPYFHSYQETVALSKMILASQYPGLSTQNDDFSAFFFDISMLFEHFIRKVLIEGGINILAKDSQIMEYPTGAKNRKMKPDIIIENEGNHFILDVKYKHFDTQNGVSREDMFQIISYAAIYSNQFENLKGIGFIFPGEKDQHPVHKEIKIHNKTIDFYLFFYPVDQVVNQDDETNDEKDNQKNFFDSIKSVNRKFNSELKQKFKGGN